MLQETPSLGLRPKVARASQATTHKRQKKVGGSSSRPRVFPASPSVVHPPLITENTETIEQMEEEHCLCIWLNALKGHF